MCSEHSRVAELHLRKGACLAQSGGSSRIEPVGFCRRATFAIAQGAISCRLCRVQWDGMARCGMFCCWARQQRLRFPSEGSGCVWVLCVGDRTGGGRGTGFPEVQCVLCSSHWKCFWKTYCNRLSGWMLEPLLQEEGYIQLRQLLALRKALQEASLAEQAEDL